MEITQADIARMLAHDAATDDRIRMVAKVTRKRAQRARTLERRSARFAKFVMQNREV